MAGKTEYGSFSNRKLLPDGTHGYPYEGMKVNTGGTKGKDFIYQGGIWKKAKHKNRPKSHNVDGSDLSKTA